jgi:hypothetical protein
MSGKRRQRSANKCFHDNESADLALALGVSANMFSSIIHDNSDGGGKTAADDDDDGNSDSDPG